MPAYDPNNIFAKILRGELPRYKIYEDDKALAFLDIMPRAAGHALVLPKAPRATSSTCLPTTSPTSSWSRRRSPRPASRCSVPTASPSSSSTKARAAKWSSTCTSTSSRARAASRCKPPASVKEAPDVLADQAKQLAAALR